jgi:hypothetical protein
VSACSPDGHPIPNEFGFVSEFSPMVASAVVIFHPNQFGHEVA